MILATPWAGIAMAANKYTFKRLMPERFDLASLECRVFRAYQVYYCSLRKSKPEYSA